MRTYPQPRSACYERACWWLAQGVALVPLKSGSKQLQPGYGARKRHITTPAVAAKWFLKTDANLAVILGAPTGLAVADWDDPHAFQKWLDTTGAEVDTLTEQTSRGFHLFFAVKNLPSAASNGCEFKTSGVCMVSPARHPSGVVYQIIRNAPILTLNEEKARTLFPFLSDTTTGPSNRHSFGNQGTQKPFPTGVIARIKAAHSIIAEMEAAEIDLRSGGQHALVGLCPFHQDHSPSLWVNPDSGLWGCNKPTCPAYGIHDVINFRALTRNISIKAAIKQLALELLDPVQE